MRTVSRWTGLYSLEIECLPNLLKNLGSRPSTGGKKDVLSILSGLLIVNVCGGGGGKYIKCFSFKGMD